MTSPWVLPIIQKHFPGSLSGMVTVTPIVYDEPKTIVEIETMIDTNKIQFWLKNNLNVLLEGEHGVGKTAVVKQAFTEKYGPMSEKWLYFSASTMDPWVDFVGIPREVSDENGSPYLDLVRRKCLRDNKIEAIFIDEFNRAPMKVRNAIMELIQFKSINGHCFDNIKVVWAAINPHDDAGTYDVDRIDPAQADRFEIHYSVPYAIDLKYFKAKYGEATATIAKTWWTELPNDIKKLVSPRRLDYALKIINLGGSIRDDVVPAKANVTKLIEALGGVSRLQEFQKLLENSDPVGAKKFLEDNANYTACKSYVVSKFKKMHTLLSPEIIGSLMFEDKRVKHFINENKDLFPGIIETTSKTGTNEEDEKLKQLYAIKELSPWNYAQYYQKIFGQPKGFKRTKDEMTRGLNRDAAMNERKARYNIKKPSTAHLWNNIGPNIAKEHGFYTRSITPNTGEDMIFNVGEEDDNLPF